MITSEAPFYNPENHSLNSNQTITSTICGLHIHSTTIHEERQNLTPIRQEINLAIENSQTLNFTPLSPYTEIEEGIST